MQERKYPLIITFKEKHGDSIYLANSEAEFYGAFREVFLERYTAGYWYFADDFKDHPGGPESWDDAIIFCFLNMRSDYEYEGFEIVTPQVST